MSTATSIEWTDASWNPVTGCTKVSPGCKHCYAETVADRFWAKQYPKALIADGASVYKIPTTSAEDYERAGLLRPRRFTDVWTHPDRLDEPLHWRKPRRVFVNSMSDLFHEKVPGEFVCRVFGAMAAAGRHTFQVLTKRPERALRLLSDIGFANDVAVFARWDDPILPWPLPNVWLGVSVEDQITAEDRIPLLLDTPAAIRFLSVEPLLKPVNLRGLALPRVVETDEAGNDQWHPVPAIDWVIVGGESGPGARPCDVAWIRSVVEQCRAANVPVFVKQLGANIRDRNDAFGGWYPEMWPEDLDPDAVEHDINGFREEYQGAPVRVLLRDHKGGSPEEWPEDLRVREFPC